MRKPDGMCVEEALGLRPRGSSLDPAVVGVRRKSALPRSTAKGDLGHLGREQSEAEGAEGGETEVNGEAGAVRVKLEVKEGEGEGEDRRRTSGAKQESKLPSPLAPSRTTSPALSNAIGKDKDGRGMVRKPAAKRRTIHPS